MFRITMLILLLSRVSFADGFIAYSRIQEPFSVTDRRFDPPSAAGVDSEYYVVMFKSETCPPCRAYVASGKLDLLKTRFKVTVVNTTFDKQWNVDRVPEFWLCRLTDRKKIQRWRGSTDLSTIEAYVKTLRQPTASVKMSHSEMVELHNSLHGGGQWSWPGNIEEHLRTVHNVDF